MGAYDSNPSGETAYGRGDPLPWSASVGGGVGIGKLVERFGGLDVGESSNGHIIQVMKAVEDAENTIKQQVKENNELKEELQRKTRELEEYKSGATTSTRLPAGGSRDDHALYRYKRSLSPFSEGNEMERTSWMNNGSHHYSESNKEHGSSKVFPSGLASADNAVTSHFSSPSSRSLSPSRHQKEVEYDPRSNLSGHGVMQMSENNSSRSILKQDLILKVREHEEEIFQLKRHLADYSMKEAQICNEKYVLEKRIAHMRMAFDQQQQDLVDAASKALSYRQDIIEENIRLTYALQAAQQERSTFMSTLLPLLAEYGFQPAVPDAMSIVSNLKVLFKHLQEKLIITEEKLKESQYQLTPWRAEALNNPSFTPQSPSHSFGAALTTSNKTGLELVPQPPYSHARSPISSPSNAQTRADWEALGHQNLPSGSSGVATKNHGLENMEKSPLSSSRNPVLEDISAQVPVTRSDAHVVRFSVESKNENLSFKDLARGNEVDDSDSSGLQHGREPRANWTSGSYPYLAPGLDDQNATYPYLPPVLEEPSSSVSEAAEDDPLPAIEGLQISGDPYPGKELQACGYSTNGTTSCNFEWVRYLEDGSVNYIEGAKRPRYLVTADDVDSYLAIEVQPLDNRKRKGELVKVFANEQRKIACDPEMQEQIERTLGDGHASFEVQLSARVLNIWEPAILAIKREGFSIKCDGARGVVITEKFSTNTNITISYGYETEFSIHSSNEIEHLLRTADRWLRDTIVLAMRLFIMRAVEKRKGRRRGLFFK